MNMKKLEPKHRRSVLQNKTIAESWIFCQEKDKMIKSLSDMNEFIDKDIESGPQKIDKIEENKLEKIEYTYTDEKLALKFLMINFEHQQNLSYKDSITIDDRLEHLFDVYINDNLKNNNLERNKYLIKLFLDVYCNVDDITYHIKFDHFDEFNNTFYFSGNEQDVIGFKNYLIKGLIDCYHNRKKIKFSSEIEEEVEKIIEEKSINYCKCFKRSSTELIIYSVSQLVSNKSTKNVLKTVTIMSAKEAKELIQASISKIEIIEVSEYKTIKIKNRQFLELNKERLIERLNKLAKKDKIKFLKIETKILNNQLNVKYK